MTIAKTSLAIRFPALDPILDPLYVGLNVFHSITLQLNYDLVVIGAPSLLKQHLHDLAIYIPL